MEKLTAQERKERPLYEGLFKYFPDALMEVAHVSYVGSQQHNPGKPMHWDKTKSKDNLDAQLRHVVDQAKGVPVDSDECLHLAKNAWRALAALQDYLEKE